MKFIQLQLNAMHAFAFILFVLTKWDFITLRVYLRDIRRISRACLCFFGCGLKKIQIKVIYTRDDVCFATKYVISNYVIVSVPILPGDFLKILPLEITWYFNFV